MQHIKDWSELDYGYEPWNGQNEPVGECMADMDIEDKCQRVNGQGYCSTHCIYCRPYGEGEE